MTAEQYFRQMFQEAGLDETTTQAFLTAANNDKLSPKMNELVRRATDDFRAMQGRVTASESKVQQYENWYTGANEQYTKAIEELNRYKSTATNPVVQTPAGVTMEDLQKTLAERDQRYSKVLKEIGRVSSRHAAKYGEELDTDALEKLALEKGYSSIEQAYKEYVGPREEEKRTKDFEDRIKREREEAVKDWASRNKLPVDPIPTETSFLHRLNKGSVEAPKDLDSELLQAWGSVKSR